MMPSGIRRPPKKEPVRIYLEILVMLQHFMRCQRRFSVLDDWRLKRDDWESLVELDR